MDTLPYLRVRFQLVCAWTSHVCRQSRLSLVRQSAESHNLHVVDRNTTHSRVRLNQGPNFPSHRFVMPAIRYRPLQLLHFSPQYIRIHRRLFADHASSALSNTSASQHNNITPTSTPTERKSPRFQDGHSSGFYMAVLGLGVISTPVIAYFYWEHRKAHMKAKKEAMLLEIQARVKSGL